MVLDMMLAEKGGVCVTEVKEGGFQVRREPEGDYVVKWFPVKN